MAQIERERENRRDRVLGGDDSPSRGASGAAEFGALLDRFFPALNKKVVSTGGDVIDIRLKYQVGGGWLVVVKRINDDGAPEVAFTGGNDFVEAFANIEGCLDKGKWRLDKPWKAPVD